MPRTAEGELRSCWWLFVGLSLQVKHTITSYFILHWNIWPVVLLKYWYICRQYHIYCISYCLTLLKQLFLIHTLFLWLQVSSQRTSLIIGSMTSTSFSPLLYIDTHFHPAQHTAASCLPSFVVASVGISSLNTALYLHLNAWCCQHDSAVPCTTLETCHQNSARYIWYQSLSS